MRAAVLNGQNEPLVIEDLRTVDVGPHDIRLRIMAAGERENAFRHLRPAPRGQQRLCRQIGRPVQLALAQAKLQQLQIADGRRQDIIEIMRDPGGKPPQRIQSFSDNTLNMGCGRNSKLRGCPLNLSIAA